MNGSELKIRAVLEADSSKFDSEIKSADKKISNLGKTGNLGDLVKNAKSEFGSLEGIATSVAGKIPIPFVAAAGAVAGVAAAVAAVGVGLFNLAKQASDYGSEIKDASDKTGIHAQTLSAMRLAADQSGTSLEQITGGVAKFSKSVAAGTLDFKAFGITSKQAVNDLDSALATVFEKIAAAPAGIQQMTLAQKAFGKSGADLLPFIKQFDGDLPGLIAKAKELGVVMSDEDAAAADDFGDDLAQLQTQIKGLTFTFAREMLPVFSDGMKDLSKWLSENKQTVKEWGESVSDVMRGIRAVAESEIAKVIYKIAEFGAKISTLGIIYQGLAKLGASTHVGVDAGVGVEAKPNFPGYPAGGGGKSSRENARKKELELIAKSYEIEAKGIGATYDAYKRTLDEQLKNEKITLDEYQKQFSKNIDDYQTKIAQIFANKESSLGQRFKGQELQNALGELKNEREQILNSLGEDSIKAGEDVRARRVKIEQTISKAQIERVTNDAQEEIAKNEDKFRRLLISEFTYLKTKENLEKKALETEREGIDRILKMDAATKAKGERFLTDSENVDYLNRRNAVQKEVDTKHTEIVAAGTLARFEIQRKYEADLDALTNESNEIYYGNERARLEKEIEAGSRKRASLRELRTLEINRIGEVLKTQTDALNKERTERLKTVEGADRQKELEEEINNLYDQRIELAEYEAGKRKENNEQNYVGGVRAKTAQKYGGGMFGDLMGDMAVMSDETISSADKMQSAADSINASWASMSETVGQSINNMIDGTSQAIESWLLYGDSIGQALKQAAAAELAHIASVSAIKAIYELAEGFALLFTHPAAAASHFKSAALFGAVAVGAGVSAKALSDTKDKSGSANKNDQSAFTANYGGNNSERDTPTFVRQNSNSSAQDNTQAISDLQATIANLNNKISSMRAGDVLTVGAQQKKNFLLETVTREANSNSTGGNKLNRALGN